MILYSYHYLKKLSCPRLLILVVLLKKIYIKGYKNVNEFMYQIMRHRILNYPRLVIIYFKILKFPLKSVIYID